MPLYSYCCPSCNAAVDLFSPIATRNEQECACGTRLTRTYTPSAVVDDSLDEWNENVAHEPVHFSSKSEKRLYLKQHNLVEFVRHVGEQGSDRSKHTTRWI